MTTVSNILSENLSNQCMYNLPFFAVVVANILQTSILALEASEAANVCVFISEEVARDLTFVITPNEDGTATGIKACVV